ncbi:NAD(P)-binding protein [Rhizoclosmatium globosum]|uniref:NAD(P)-binding protein n=1 Tax=Rhizoclosmatium globosum TaxID=329046 RepID=A0A1Y2BMM4_9FUNG|nr:NAD(P)-binding protein [Rhizoclosmatium globosum]|eukprot:ORY35993.1 NAD(P)-binding protein [Rhizoclosmatium globosum]
MSLVLVTGASGYIGNHIVTQFLSKGYRVRGTVRDPSNKVKCGHLHALIAAGKPLELVAADLLQAEDWPAAIQGVDYVVHSASPFIIDVSEADAEQRLIKPAVDGTTNVLKVALATKSVKKIVLTSSIAAIMEGRPDLEQQILGPNKKITAEEWTDVNHASPYPRSKTLAEKAAWALINSAETNPRNIPMTTIHPGFVTGPTLCGNDGTSISTCIKFMERAVPLIPYMNFPAVDVRDVADMHVGAVEVGESDGKRLIAVGENLWFHEWAQYLAKEFNPLGFKVPTAIMPNALAWVVSFVRPDVKALVPILGKTLGITFTPMSKSIVDMGHSLVQLGLVTKK